MRFISNKKLCGYRPPAPTFISIIFFNLFSWYSLQPHHKPTAARSQHSSAAGGSVVMATSVSINSRPSLKIKICCRNATGSEFLVILAFKVMEEYLITTRIKTLTFSLGTYLQSVWEKCVGKVDVRFEAKSR